MTSPQPTARDAARRRRIATLSQVTRLAALVIAVALPLAGLA